MKFFGNMFWRKNDIDNETPLFGHPGEVSDEENANLVSSLCEDGWHRPVIDIDLPTITLKSTNGGLHLFIDKPMSFGNYLKLLRTMAEVGIVEWGYYYAVKKAGMSQVRKPGVAKSPVFADTGNPRKAERSVNTMPLMQDMILEEQRQFPLRTATFNPVEFSDEDLGFDEENVAPESDWWDPPISDWELFGPIEWEPSFPRYYNYEEF